MTGAVCGYVSGQETSIRKALGSPLSPIWREKKNFIDQQFPSLITDYNANMQVFHFFKTIQIPQGNNSSKTYQLEYKAVI